jgi:hypothetical protein
LQIAGCTDSFLNLQELHDWIKVPLLQERNLVEVAKTRSIWWNLTASADKRSAFFNALHPLQQSLPSMLVFDA